jgi:hypothetical protein
MSNDTNYTLVGRIQFECADKYRKILAEEWAKNAAIVRREAQKGDAGIAFASNGVKDAEPPKSIKERFDSAYKALQNTLEERGASYGKFSANTERFYDHYTKILPYLDFYDAKGYDQKYLSGSAAHLAVKTARLWGHITEANPNLDTVADTCVDILGYCTIIHRDLLGASEDDYNMLQVYNREPHISEQLGKYLLHKNLVAEAKEIVEYYLNNFQEMWEVEKTSGATYSPEFKRFQSMFK